MSSISGINVHKLTDPIQTGYYNQAITVVNDHVIRVSVMTSGYPWHLHPNSDETFIVMEGTLVLETITRIPRSFACRFQIRSKRSQCPVVFWIPMPQH
jgi:hypothetical protein